jgi:two-component system, chemotaxis family, CheB/CheR fusion protein
MSDEITPPHSDTPCLAASGSDSHVHGSTFKAGQGSTEEDVASTKNASLSSELLSSSDGTETKTPRYVIGIGASAGGLEALETLFESMPLDSGFAFIIVQHLSPDFKSLMEELLARRTKIPIHRVEDGMHVEANNIYLLPPRKEMVVLNGQLRLHDRDSTLFFSLPIDTFFRSLAVEARERAVGVILSGTGSDGSRGVRAIRESGGLVIVQSAETAKFDGMPRSAIDTGTVDYVMPAGEIPSLLLRFADQPSREYLPNGRTYPSALQGSLAIFDMLRAAYGIDFTHYKQNTVVRRIERRIQISGCVSIDDYTTKLRENFSEVVALYKDLLIGVTQFFRDREAFLLLQDQIIPRLISALPMGDDLRVWIAGCATGEEAYSVAILLDEAFHAIKRNPLFKIFATDVHKESLEFASTGIYTEDSLENVSEVRLEKYFKRVGDCYQVTPHLRRGIVFAPHNLIKDAPFTKLDLVTCRNLLIYLQPYAQKKAVSLFHFGLRKNGILFLGPSEMLGDLSDEFIVVDKHWKMFSKSGDSRSFPSLPLTVRSPSTLPIRQQDPRSLTLSFPAHASQLLGLYGAVLDEIAPASILIDDRRRVVHTFGGGSKLLRPQEGPLSTDVLELVGAPLRLTLSNALQKAKTIHSSAHFKKVLVNYDGQERVADMCIRPLTSTRVSPGHQLLEFTLLEDAQSEPRVESEGTSLFPSGLTTSSVLSALETELSFTRETLQSTIEELEASNEELQATNEELVASNEELQSTNEELHSVNEELYTVNAEYQNKITELTQVTNDVDNLLKSCDVGLIFLDRERHIRKFTPRIASLFNLIPRDIGRPIDSFASQLRDEQFLPDIDAVANGAPSIEREVRDKQGRWYLLRLLPYSATGITEGVIVTLFESTLLKKAEKRLSHFSSLVEHSQSAIVSKSLDGIIETWNEAAHCLLGYTSSEMVGESVQKILPLGATDEVPELFKNGSAARIETVRRRKDGTLIPIYLSSAVIRNEDDVITGYSSIMTDATEYRRTADALKESEYRFRHLVQTVPALIWMINAHGNYTYFNERWQDFIGISSTEELSRTWTRFIHPDDTSLFSEPINRALLNKEGFTTEFRLLNLNGEYRWLSLQAVPRFVEDGSYQGLIASAFDIDDRKISEDAVRRNEIELADFFEQATIGLHWMSEEGTILRANRAGKVLFGCEHNDCIGKSFADFFREAKERDEFFTRISKGEPINEMECTLTTPNGLIKQVVIDASTLWHQGTKVHVRCFIRDITPVRHMADSLKEASKRRDAVIATVSHELRNPLNALLNATHLIDDERSDEPIKVRAFQVIKRQARHMSSLLTDLFDVSKVTRGKLELDKRLIDIRDSIKDAVDIASPLLESRSQKINVTLFKEPLLIRGDGARLVQVLENLISNASKYSPIGTDISINVEPQGNEACLTVIDHGIGIDASLKEVIFEPFVRGSSPEGETTGGIGLGLTLVKTLVELHEGGVYVESSGKDKGSTFVVRLPLVSDEKALRRLHLTSPLSTHEVSVLIIEDNPDNLSMFRTFLELDGYKVFTADCGLGGIELFKEKKPDLLFIDIGLPDISGLEVSRTLRESFSRDQVYLVALTGYCRPEDKRAIKEAGFDDHLIKPFDKAYLEDILAKVRLPHHLSHPGMNSRDTRIHEVGSL